MKKYQQNLVAYFRYLNDSEGYDVEKEAMKTFAMSVLTKNLDTGKLGNMESTSSVGYASTAAGLSPTRRTIPSLHECSYRTWAPASWGTWSPPCLFILHLVHLDFHLHIMQHLPHMSVPAELGHQQVGEHGVHVLLQKENRAREERDRKGRS